MQLIERTRSRGSQTIYYVCLCLNAPGTAFVTL